jgi:hypothetical protein
MSDFDKLENRYGSAFVQELRDRIAVCELKEVQYFELKQMNDSILPRYRSRVRELVNSYREWKEQYCSEEDQIEKVYKAYDGIFLRNQLKDALRMYEMANKDYHEMQRMYFEDIKKMRPPYTSFRDRAAAA